MGDDLQAVLSQYRASLTPLIEGIQQKRNNPPNVHTTDPSAPSNGGRSQFNDHSRPSRSHAPQSETVLVPLQSHLSNLFYGILVQDDDNVFNLIYSQNWRRTPKYHSANFFLQCHQLTTNQQPKHTARLPRIPLNRRTFSV